MFVVVLAHPVPSELWSDSSVQRAQKMRRNEVGKCTFRMRLHGTSTTRMHPVESLGVAPVESLAVTLV